MQDNKTYSLHGIFRADTSRKSKTAGFTIVELLIVIVVIGILATITIVAYNGVQDRARATVLQSDLRQAQQQLMLDQVDSGSYPASTATANDGKGLKASPGTTYQYSVNNTANPPTFCLSAVNDSQGYSITNSGSATEGVCSGHTGPVAGGSVSCDAGYIPVPGNSTFGTSDFCIAKYEMKNDAGTAKSQAAGSPWVSISQTSAITAASDACSGCHLITEAEWLTVAHNVLNVDSNWSGGSVGSGFIYSGHNDNSPAGALAASSNDSDGYAGTGNSSGNQRRTLTLTNGEVVWDMAGNVYDWTSGQTSGGQPGLTSETAYAWKDWNAATANGSLSPNPFPSYGTPAASGWNSGQGIGQLYSNAGETGLRGFLRGGGWYTGGDAGVLTLLLYDSPSNPGGYVGFRVAR